MTRRPTARSQPPGRTRLQPAEDGDDRLGLLFIKEVTRSRHGVKGEGAYGALQQPHLGRPHVALVRRPADDEADGAADVAEVGPQLLRLARVRHCQVRLEGRVETAGGSGEPMPSGSTTMVRYPAPFRSGTSLRNPNSEPNNPGMRTTGGPAPEVSTCRDSVAARGTMKLWRSAVSASNATARSQTIVPSGFEPTQEI